jgi:enoyl-[acyl-carrier protein] reductase/trans-2-enoyl-CoA reductase (NAD+)
LERRALPRKRLAAVPVGGQMTRSRGSVSSVSGVFTPVSKSTPLATRSPRLCSESTTSTSMPQQIVKRRSRGFICVNAHPEGCRRNVERQIAVVSSGNSLLPPAAPGLVVPHNVLVIGASTGYGLASRITAAWGYDARTLGVFFERPPDDSKTATAGYYNTLAFDERAKRDGLFAAHLNGDAFSDECKREALAIIRRELAPIDLVIYSLASPKRADPRNGTVYNSALKPIGAPYSNRTIELDSEKVVDITLPPATDKEIADTIAVMGGEDWRMWMEALASEGLLAPGVCTVAYSYIGPALTWPIYRDGTIGRAKQDLDKAALAIDAMLAPKLDGRALVSVNKAVVTQASAAIPVVPLYLSLLSKVMRAKGLEENPIEQMRRLFADFLTQAPPARIPKQDDDARIRLRLDDREMRPDVQAEVAALWPQVNTENLRTLTDFAGFQRDFRNLFGFEVEGVDYDRPVETDVTL